MFCFIHARFTYLSPSLQQILLYSENLINFANVVHNKGISLDNCWGFIDDTVRAC